MFARVMSGLVKLGRMDELVSIYQDSIAPTAKEQKGFKNAILLTHPDTGKYVSITLWETKADMEAGEASGYLQEQVAKAGPTLAGSPVRETFEVSVHT
jgi:heme-degrading monooxygenase HmoA